eukprot:3905510-Prymnesium_polylepis.1
MVRRKAVLERYAALQCLWHGVAPIAPIHNDGRWPKTPEGDRFSAPANDDFVFMGQPVSHELELNWRVPGDELRSAPPHVPFVLMDSSHASWLI